MRVILLLFNAYVPSSLSGRLVNFILHEQVLLPLQSAVSPPPLNGANAVSRAHTCWHVSDSYPSARQLAGIVVFIVPFTRAFDAYVLSPLNVILPVILMSLESAVALLHIAKPLDSLIGRPLHFFGGVLSETGASL